MTAPTIGPASQTYTFTPGVAWYAVVVASFDLAFIPQLGFGAVGHSVGLAFTPQIGMGVATNATASFGLSFTPNIGVLPPQISLVFTPQIGMSGKPTYGPETFGLNFGLRIGMQNSPQSLGRQFGVAVSRAATI